MKNRWRQKQRPIIDREAKVVEFIDFLNSYITMQKLSSKSDHKISYGYDLSVNGVDLIEIDKGTGYYHIEFIFYSGEMIVEIEDYSYGDIAADLLTLRLTLKKDYYEIPKEKVLAVQNLFKTKFTDTSGWGNHLKEIYNNDVNHDYVQKQFIKLIKILNEEITT